MRKIWKYSLVLVSACLLNSCASKTEKEMASTSKISVNIDARIDSILPLLTLEEKVDLCHAQSKFSTKGVERLGIPEIWMSDGPHGVRAEISWDSWDYAGWTNDSITAFPALTCLAATFNPELAGEYGFNLGEEARYREKDVLLGPGVNMYRTPFNGRNFEYMGEDPFLASTMVVPYIKGVQENGVAACVKHFALNNQEHWRDLVNVEVSDRALHEIYLPAFKAAVQDADVWAIMGAYNKFRGQYTTHHELLTNKILKGDWKFDGVVISDWSSTHSTLEAANNGLDIEMGTGTDGLGTTTANHYQHYYLANPFLEKIKSGAISEAVLNDKVRRVLRLRLRTNMNEGRPLGRANNVEHHEVARKVATEGIVLLKNEANFFPIEDQSGLTITVIGENATRSMTAGGGSSELKPKFEISPLEGIKARYKKAKVLHTMGYETGASEYDIVHAPTLNQDSLKAEAIKLAKAADVVLFVGGLNKSHLQDCEGDDRQQFGLPFGQETLIDDISKANENLGFILLTGNAVAMPWLDKVKGLVESWYLGSMAGHAIADVISGDVNPSGKLPFSFPKQLKDNGAHSFGETSYPGVDMTQHYKEDILVGYRWHDTKNIAPQYAFGYGLSYTSFELKNMTSDKENYSKDANIKINCTVSNTGDLAGAEVVQVYVGKKDSKVDRALKELKGFAKVSLNKGERKSIDVEIPVSKLAFYNADTANWEIETGDYEVYVGNASNNISETLKITIN
ncbi:glycoside hydrolase family 3 C-terminal domain-containing protein [Tamlana agarivorans]|uniref:Glycoside hydrolase family 3 C-terminal domain-containing protein n=1 Tax=Pseudotamlana agarivorans TaxID=481183 RepID=A0ACC5U6H9_9FLAO|nr:glycoside hydrolase family 3 C-terminal domain-containing protein [Tamlana agarivorans]MBU2949911.1 glycoside hydrolase family 3 C-terminal domain-containing protein [Tamlana agarivorans]